MPSRESIPCLFPSCEVDRQKNGFCARHLVWVEEATTEHAIRRAAEVRAMWRSLAEGTLAREAVAREMARYPRLRWATCYRRVMGHEPGEVVA